MKLIFVASCAAVLACAAPAQISGSINRGAPVVSNAITLGTNKLEISYTSIRFGQGQWQKILEAADQHEGFNTAAAKKPIGTVKTSVAVMAAGKQVPAGEYALFFTVSPRGWALNLKPATGEPIRWGLMLKPASTKSECMRLSLEPTAEKDSCALTICFGDQAVTVPVKVGEAAAPPAEPKKG